MQGAGIYALFHKTHKNIKFIAYMKANGILLHVVGLWVLSGLDASGKYLALVGVPVLLVAWVRYAVHTALSSAILLPRRGRALLRTHSLRGQLLRGVLMIASTLLFFSVLKRVPLAEATAMNFMAPVFLLALAPWLLHEPHRLHRWLGVALGFAGMLLVVRPGAGLDTVGVLLGLATALTFAAFQIATRRLAGDDPLTTNYYGGLVGTVALTPLLPWVWELPDATTALGIACICGAGIAVALVERRLNRAMRAAPVPPAAVRSPRPAPMPPSANCHGPRSR